MGIKIKLTDMKKYYHQHKDQILRRLKIIEGHLRKVREMVEDDKYCIDIINQSLAVQNALKEVDALLLEDHLSSCIPKAIPGIDKKKQQELLKLYRASRK